METAQQLRDRGMQTALETADNTYSNWSGKAYGFLLEYIKTHQEFMIEEVRDASINSVPIPPSNRAWGSIVIKAAKAGLIERVGFRSVKNKKAHCTPAAVWRTKNVLENAL